MKRLHPFRCAILSSPHAGGTPVPPTLARPRQQRFGPPQQHRRPPVVAPTLVMHANNKRKVSEVPVIEEPTEGEEGKAAITDSRHKWSDAKAAEAVRASDVVKSEQSVARYKEDVDAKTRLVEIAKAEAHDLMQRGDSLEAYLAAHKTLFYAGKMLRSAKRALEEKTKRHEEGADGAEGDP